MFKYTFDVFNLFLNFSLMLKNNFKLPSKLYSLTMQKSLLSKIYFSNRGILYTFSCIERSQQNNAVERKHLNILHVARFLMFKSNFPIQFWDECIKTVIFLMNLHPVLIWVINPLMGYYLINCLITLLIGLLAHYVMLPPFSHIHISLALGLLQLS